MSNLQKREISEFIQKNADKLLATLPSGYSGYSKERFIAMSLQAMAKSPKLFMCDKMSLFSALVQSIQLGLEPNGPMGEAYILPYGRTANFQLGYRGMLKLIMQSGKVCSIDCVIVDEADEFKVMRGLKQDIVHVPSMEPTGQMKAVYAVAILDNGHPKFEVMLRRDVEQIRQRSRSADSGPWKTDYNEMAKVKCFRRLFKMLPISAEIQSAIVLDEAADAGIAQPFTTTLEPLEEIDPNEKMKGLLNG